MIEMSSSQYQNKSPREVVASGGFSVDYEPVVTDQELYDDIVSYLGEYRFALQKYDYDLEFSDGAVRDSRRGEPMSVKAGRSVKERLMRGESINREAAEASGINFLDKQLVTAEIGDSVVWASPPGEKSEGYGDYGFFYVGQVRRSIENRKQIKMSALRVEQPTLERFNNAFNALTGIDVDAQKPEDFLKFPVVIQKQLSEEFVIQTLGEHFPFKLNSEQRRIFDIAKIRLKPKIDAVISRIRWGSTEEKRRALHALENYSLTIKKELEEGIVSVYELESGFDVFIKTYGHEPPKVDGSCPIKTNNLMSFGLDALNSFLEDEGFTCPKCHVKAEGPVGNQCPHCGITKEQYAAEASGPLCN